MRAVPADGGSRSHGAEPALPGKPGESEEEGTGGWARGLPKTVARRNHRLASRGMAKGQWAPEGTQKGADRTLSKEDT